MTNPGHDNELLRKIRRGDLCAYESLFNEYYVMLGIIARSFVKNQHVAEEIVEDVFIKVWERRNYAVINTSLRAYLIKAVQNRCINYLKQQKNEREKKEKISENINYEFLRWSENYPIDKLLDDELSDAIEKAVGNLPERCRQIFLLSRDKELQYDEIAESLKISVNTVKTQMKIALARLREELKEYF